MFKTNHLFFLIVLALKINMNAQPIIYYCHTSDLFRLDISNCSTKYIGGTANFVSELAFTPDGRLWGTSYQNLYSIDTSNGSATLIGPILNSNSLAAWDDSTLIIESNKKLYKVNTNNAHTTYLDTIGYSGAGDLVRYDNALYMTTTNSKLLRIVFNNNLTSTVSLNQVSNIIHNSMALATASFVGSTNYIIGFEDKGVPDADIIKICPLDGTYTHIPCPGLMLGNPYGATSRMLAVQNPEPTACVFIPTAVWEKDAQQDLVVSPNPFQSKLRLNFLPENRSSGFSIEIIDLMGTKIYNQRNIHEEDIDLDFLAKGIYFLILETSTRQQSLKIIKE